jgi:ADP-ribose pyrophosphatase
LKPSKPSDLTEHFVSGERVYEGGLLKVHRDVVRLPDGRQGTREYIRHPGAVAIVPLFDDGTVLLERQFRYPHRREFIEVPAGKLEPGEPPLATAKRELMEETGYAAEEWTRLGVIHTAIGYSDETIELFLARGLSARGAPKLDAGEFV